MTIETFENGSCLTVTPIGRVDSVASDELQAVLEKQFTPDRDQLILDFAQVDYISSKGLRVLVSVYKALGGRKMEIVHANASVTEVLRISGMLHYFVLK